jgi:hypothetical protein
MLEYQRVEKFIRYAELSMNEITVILNILIPHLQHRRSWGPVMGSRSWRSWGQALQLTFSPRPSTFFTARLTVA